MPERDWKLFRKLHDVALERYCEQVLRDVERLAASPGKSAHARYLDIYQLMGKRDRKLANAFDGMSRTFALQKLAIINSYGLLTKEEVAAFSEETQQILSLLSDDPE